MSNRLDKTFQQLKQKHEGALVVFVTAGDPSVEGTPALVATLADAGADIVELGIPYSDPLADGPTVQNSSQRALERGVTPTIVLEMVRNIRQKTDVPLVLMTSYNLVLRCGLHEFAKSAAEAGADAFILTDLPPEEAGPWEQEAVANGLATVFMAAPTSTKERLQRIAEHATGFVYCVSRTGVTGARQDVPEDLVQTLQGIRDVTAKPICVGFGVSTPAHVRQIVSMADGAVIGSALVDFLHVHRDDPECDEALRQLVGNWKAATRHGSE